MVANRRRGERGQSLVEFAFLVPLLIGMVSLLVEVDTAISASIVGQKYTRQHMHFLFFSSANYPQLNWVSGKDGFFKQRWWIGVDEQVIVREDTEPIAPKFKVGRKKVPEGQESDPDSPVRQNVRIRSSAFTCVPPIGANVGQYYTENYIRDRTFESGSFGGYCSEQR